MTARIHLEPYPAIRAMTDEELCTRTARAMCDDELGNIETATCHRCGMEFEYTRNGPKRRTRCDDCAGKNLYKPSDGVRDVEYVLCVVESEFYHSGARYQRIVVYDDIFNGLAKATDFEDVRDDFKSYARIHRNLWRLWSGLTVDAHGRYSYQDEAQE